MTRHCCAAMARHANWSCDQHDDPFACPDARVLFSPRFQEYGLVIHDGGTGCSGIDFCPWCGHRLPESRRDRWFDELEGRGIDPWEDEVPPEFQDDRWLHRANDDDRVTSSWTIQHFSPANPAGPTQADVPALLRRVADSIEELGRIQIADLVLHQDATEDGPCFSMTVYFHQDELEADP